MYKLIVFLISSYGTPLAQRAFFIWQFSLWASGAVNYDYIATNSINSLLAQDVFSMAHTLTIFEPIWSMLQNLSKTMKLYNR